MSKSFGQLHVGSMRDTELCFVQRRPVRWNLPFFSDKTSPVSFITHIGLMFCLLVLNRRLILVAYSNRCVQRVLPVQRFDIDVIVVPREPCSKVSFQ